MKFFGEHGPDLDENLFVHILSFVDYKTLVRSRGVTKAWRESIDTKTKHKEVPFLPAIQRIPQLYAFPVDTLFNMKVQQFKEGMTNTTFKLEIKGNKWVLRLPGKGSSAFINREDEAFNAMLASDLKLNVTIDYFGRDGLELTRYLEDNQAVSRATILANPRIIPAIAQLFKQLHSSTVPFRNTINVFTRNLDLFENLVAKDYPFPDIATITHAMERAGRLFQQYRIAMTPCHNDTTPTNFLLAHDEIKLLDWEYSGNNDRLWDLTYFALYSELPREHEVKLLSSYFGECNEAMLAWFDLYKPVIAWWVLLWSWTQLANKADACPVAEYQKLADDYYEITKKASESFDFQHALDLIEGYARTFSDTTTIASTSTQALVPRPF